MRLPPTLLSAGLVLMIAFYSASGQSSAQTREKGQDTAQSETNSPTATEDMPLIQVHLAGGGRMQVDEVTETADGFWYRRGNVTTFLDKSRVVRIERPEDIKPTAAADTVADGWSIADSMKVENFFMSRFNRHLPLTAFGQSDLHTRWGLDHHQGIDVGLHPESTEGRALISFLRTEGIPFLAFRSAIPGVATGPHIHIGKGSHRLATR